MFTTGLISFVVLFNILLLCLLGPAWNCNHLLEEERASCFAFYSFISYAVVHIILVVLIHHEKMPILY